MGWPRASAGSSKTASTLDLRIGPPACVACTNWTVPESARAETRIGYMTVGPCRASDRRLLRRGPSSAIPRRRAPYPDPIFPLPHSGRRWEVPTGIGRLPPTDPLGQTVSPMVGRLSTAATASAFDCRLGPSRDHPAGRAIHGEPIQVLGTTVPHSLRAAASRDCNPHLAAVPMWPKSPPDRTADQTKGGPSLP